MRRREFIAGFGAAAYPFMARAQQTELVRRVGVLIGGAAGTEDQALYTAFLRRLDELGWAQERTVRVELRWGSGPQQLGAAARELLAWQPDVILAYPNLAVAELKPIAGDVPIVFALTGDAVGNGYVASLARPGGNVTGVEFVVPAMGSKWLELLKEAVPSLKRALTLIHPETASHWDFWYSIREAASKLGVEATVAGVHDAAEILDAISSFASRPDGGIITVPSAVTNANSELIVALELRHRLPGVHAANDGSLLRYGPDSLDEIRKAAEYVDRILRGAKPADLPVQAPTKFLLTINLKNAKAIGLEISPAILLRADEVIE